MASTTGEAAADAVITTTVASPSERTRVGRPPQWTDAKARKLARLYVYTTLPVEKIIKAVFPNETVKKNSAQKTMHKMFGHDPRQLRPPDRQEMNRRFELINRHSDQQTAQLNRVETSPSSVITEPSDLGEDHSETISGRVRPSISSSSLETTESIKDLKMRLGVSSTYARQVSVLMNRLSTIDTTGTLGMEQGVFKASALRLTAQCQLTQDEELHSRSRARLGGVGSLLGDDNMSHDTLDFGRWAQKLLKQPAFIQSKGMLDEKLANSVKLLSSEDRQDLASLQDTLYQNIAASFPKMGTRLEIIFLDEKTTLPIDIAHHVPTELETNAMADKTADYCLVLSELMNYYLRLLAPVVHQQTGFIETVTSAATVLLRCLCDLEDRRGVVEEALLAIHANFSLFENLDLCPISEDLLKAVGRMVTEFHTFLSEALRFFDDTRRKSSACAPHAQDDASMDSLARTSDDTGRERLKEIELPVERMHEAACDARDSILQTILDTRPDLVHTHPELLRSMKRSLYSGQGIESSQDQVLADSGTVPSSIAPSDLWPSLFSGSSGEPSTHLSSTFPALVDIPSKNVLGDLNEGEDPHDTSSLYSDETVLPLRRGRERYEAEMADDLLGYLYSVSKDPENFDKIAIALPQLLQGFARKLGAEQPQQVYRDVMRYVHKYRRSITSLFKEGVNVQAQAEGQQSVPTGPDISYTDKVGSWLPGITVSNEGSEMLPDRNPADSFAGVEDDDDNNAVLPVPDLEEYQKVITQSAAYRWLLSRIRCELLFAVPGQAKVSDAISEVVFSQPNFRRVSRKHAPPRCDMSYEVDWDPLTFLEEQAYGYAPAEAFRKALTLTGIPDQAEGLACEDYICRTWPQSGKAFLDLILLFLTSEGKQESRTTVIDGTVLVASTRQPMFKIHASGPADTVVEVGEQLAWVSSAMRSSNNPACTYCTPSIERAAVKEQTATCVSISIKFRTPRLNTSPQEDLGAQCWRHLFRNPVIVAGFPILRRAQQKSGLELSITTLAALAGGNRINRFKEHVFIKGFCTMMVAMKRIGNMTLWHVLTNEDGSDIHYHDPRVQEISPQTDLTAETTAAPAMRHVVGWWSHVKSYAGAVDAGYEIRGSALPPPGPGFALEKVNLGVSQYISLSGTVALGRRDRPLRIGTLGVYSNQVRRVATQYVVLYDVEERKSWLLDGASVLLHLLRLSLMIDEENAMPLLHTHRDISDASTGPGPIIPVQVLTSNMNLKLYEQPDDEDTKTERKWSSANQSGPAGEVMETNKKTWYRVKDRIDLLYSILDEIFNHQSDFSSTGVQLKVKKSPRKQLEGFDFWDIASGTSPILPRATTIKPPGKGWVDLVRELQAVTLFGRGFGEILRPEAFANFNGTETSILPSPSTICTYWNKVPPGHDYLATSNATLSKILKHQGDATSAGKPWRIANGIYIHSPDRIFEPCNCATANAKGSVAKKCDRVLVPLPEKLLVRRAFRSPSDLPEEGAVIFGHSRSYPLRWLDIGDPVEGDVDLEPDEEIVSSVGANTSTAGSGVGSSGIESTRPSTLGLSSLNSQQAASSQTSVGETSDLAGNLGAIRRVGGTSGVAGVGRGKRQRMNEWLKTNFAQKYFKGGK